MGPIRAPEDCEIGNGLGYTGVMADGQKFHERFGIEIGGVEEAKRRFVSRVSNFLSTDVFGDNYKGFRNQAILMRAIADELGMQYIWDSSGANYIKGDFHRALQVLEGLWTGISLNIDGGWGTERDESVRELERVSGAIARWLNKAEIDPGVKWENGKFSRTGAQLLDERLVAGPLRWLKEAPKFKAVLEPFEKGLRHYLHMRKDPKLGSDVVTDMYESVEALAQIITGRPSKDLSANREAFIAELGLSDHYKAMLKNYIEYANDMRHAKEGKPKAVLSPHEVEAFMYLTGLFIRLAMQVMPIANVE
jgi:hypothetical protein